MSTEFLFSHNSHDFWSLLVWPKVPPVFGRAGVSGAPRTTHIASWKARLSTGSCSVLPPSGGQARSQVEHPEGWGGEVLVLSKGLQMNTILGHQHVTHSFPTSEK